MAKLKAKVKGQHRFIMVTSHVVSDQSLKQLKTNGYETIVISQNSMIGTPDIGCIDCERPFREAVSKPCPSPAAPEFASDTEAY